MADLSALAVVGLGRRIATDASESRYNVQLGVEGLVRWKVFTGGLGTEWKAVLFRNSLGVHGMAGLSLPISVVRIDLLGVVGLRHYSDWGRAIVFSDDPGATASLAYAGARLRVLFKLNVRREEEALVGLSVGYDDDLERRRVSYSFTETPWLFGGEPYQRMGEQLVGARHWTLALVGGAAFRIF